MLRNSDRGRMSLGMWLGFALSVTACGASNNPAGGTGGGAAQQPTAPVGPGTAAPAAMGKTGSAPPANAPTSSGGSAGQKGPGQPGPDSTPSGSAGTGNGKGDSGAAPPPASGDAGTGSAPTGDGGPTTPPHGDLGKGDGSDVITIGDSWMSIVTNGGGIEGGLDRAGTAYRHYAIAGTTLIGGDIPQQYARAKAANPKIATVIMTGGGNDVMFSGGCNTKEACAMSVQAIVDALDMLWTQMATDGVKDVIFIMYSANVGTAPMGTRPDMAAIPPICLTGKITCHSVPTTDLVGPGDSIDGIHPTLAACDRIAKSVMDLMQSTGIRR
jgi:hypothetical protein